MKNSIYAMFPEECFQDWAQSEFNGDEYKNNMISNLGANRNIQCTVRKTHRNNQFTGVQSRSFGQKAKMLQNIIGPVLNNARKCPWL